MERPGPNLLRLGLCYASTKIKGETIQDVLRDNSEIDIAIFLKKVIKIRDEEREKEKPKNKPASNTTVSMGLSLSNGR